jgi:hypothetical protein
MCSTDEAIMRMSVPKDVLRIRKRVGGVGAGAGGGGIVAADAGVSGDSSDASCDDLDDDDGEPSVLYADIERRVGQSRFLRVGQHGVEYQQLNEELRAIVTHTGAFTDLYSAVLVGCPARCLLSGGALRDVPGFEPDTDVDFERSKDPLKLATVLIVTFHLSSAVSVIASSSLDCRPYVLLLYGRGERK